VRWIQRITADLDVPPVAIGGKAHGLVALRRLGLPVPPAFVITTAAGRAFASRGRPPAGLDDELAAAIADLEGTTGRRLGAFPEPLTVSVRSGAAVSMPGMLATVLNVGNPEQLRLAIAAVFESWDAPRARTYRQLNGVPEHLGTAVIVQAMVYGNRDDRSGSGVAFSRDPNTGEPAPDGEVLFGHQGDDVVSGRLLTRPLTELVDRLPEAWADLQNALVAVEGHFRDASYVEFTVECGQLWLLQARPGRFAGAAAVRVAVDLADAGVISRDEALRRVSPRDLGLGGHRIASTEVVFARGIGASPGVAMGRVATTVDAAVRMAARGPVILVRPETSPLDLAGLAAAAGVVTARGGPASHAAIVARSMGKPAVVGVAGLEVGEEWMQLDACIVDAGTRVSIDGAGGEVVLGIAATIQAADDPYLACLLGWADEVCGDHSPRPAAQRLGDAHAALGR
jgi:pyruvate,orthophosphate dikinase